MPGRRSAILLALLAAIYAWSAYQPADRATWWMEVLPVFLVLPLVISLDRRLRLTPLALALLAFEAVVVAVGAHYTYAHVPVGFTVSSWLGFERNHYDRFAHFFQGVVPGIAVREILLRTSPLVPGRWLFTLVSACCLAMSAIDEFIEWGAAIAFAEGATEFLGTQGDPWDTQWDMFLALLGAMTVQALLGRLHDRQMAASEHRRPGA